MRSGLISYFVFLWYYIKIQQLCVCVFLYLLHTEYQNTHSTGKVRTLWGNKDILVGPRNSKGPFEG